MSNIDLISKFWTFISKRLDAEAPLADWRLMVGNGLDFDKLQWSFLVSTGKSANLITCPKPCSPACGFRKVCEYEGQYEAVCREWPLKSYPFEKNDAQIFTVNTGAIVPELVRVFQIRPRPSAFNNEKDTWQLGEVSLPGGKSATVYFTLKIWDHEVTDLVYRINSKEKRPYILMVTARKVIHPTSDAILKDMGAVFVPLNEVTDFNAEAELHLIQECNLAYLIAPPVAHPEPEPDNILRWCGDAWEVRFAGGEKFMLTTGHTGATYLHFMLGRPNVATPVIEIMRGYGSQRVCSLDQLVNSDGKLDGYALAELPASGIDNIADETALLQYRQTAKLLLIDINGAMANGDNVTAEQLQHDLDRITQTINEAVSPAGQKRILNDPLRRINNSFRNTINKIIKRIMDYDEGMGEHLKNSITCGINPIYAPTKEIIWQL